MEGERSMEGDRKSVIIIIVQEGIEWHRNKA